MSGSVLDHLEPGQQIIFGGDRVATVSADLAHAFSKGDRLLVDTDTGELLHIPASVAIVATEAVDAAAQAFAALASCDDASISAFFEAFADLLTSEESFAPIRDANRADVEAAERSGRSTTRLVLDDKMRAGMVEGLRSWATSSSSRSRSLSEWRHKDWSVSATSAPLGVVGFVFEGRPNVLADAAGVIRTGNTAVFRIGSDAFRTATAIMQHAATPALEQAGLPASSLVLLRTIERSGGWALFSDRRLALAVARGSGPAAAQLGSVARQNGTMVSLHGTGGAWLIVDGDVDPQRVESVVTHSLDRKVCNTLNTVVITDDTPDTVVAAILGGIDRAAQNRSTSGRIHASGAGIARLESVDADRLSRVVDVERSDGVHSELAVTELSESDLGVEWEWENSPEVSVHAVTDLDEAVAAFNRWSPRFVASVITVDLDGYQRAIERLDAPFVGNGMTRWVDGQYALDAPELGLSNWESGRLLGRGGILSGDGIYTVRLQAETPPDLSR